MKKLRVESAALAIAMVLFGMMLTGAVGVSVKEIDKVVQFIRPGAGDWGHHVVVAGDGTDAWVTENNSAYGGTDEAELHCFPWDSVLYIDCEGDASVYVVMDDDVTVGRTTTHGEVTDPGTPPNGIGNVKWVEANQPVYWPILRQMFPQGAEASDSKPGYRQGACTAPASVVGFPADNANDCSSGGAFSATAIPTCAFVVIDAGAATTCKVGQEI